MARIGVHRTAVALIANSVVVVVILDVDEDGGRVWRLRTVVEDVKDVVLVVVHVADVSFLVTLVVPVPCLVCIGLVKVLVIRTIVARIPDLVVVSVLLSWIGHCRTIVNCVLEAVVVIVVLTRVSFAVTVRVVLVSVGHQRAVVSNSRSFWNAGITSRIVHPVPVNVRMATVAVPCIARRALAEADSANNWWGSYATTNFVSI